MFTGIVERTLELQSVLNHPGGRRLIVEDVWDDTQVGESIAINGACLTVAEIVEKKIHFDCIRETLNHTNLSLVKPGDQVNVERALRAGSRIDGHFVQGHVDGTGVLVNKIADDTEWRYTIEAPETLARYLAPKGSICVDGASLTIAALNGRRFDVALIPTTLAITTLKQRDAGWAFNLECDMFAKQIVTFLELRNPTT